ncbi:MAG: cytochrome c maturation protein CcmE [Chloroflexota bacterium]
MAEATWEKPKSIGLPSGKGGRWKFLVGGVMILAAVAYLIATGMAAGARYYITVDDLISKAEYAGKSVRVAGVVLGDSIKYDDKNLILDFTVANVPMNYDNLADALHLAATNSTATRIQVHIENQVKPDLLRNEAQAIMTGKMGADGVFYATELNLKCPTRFEEAQPGQEIVNPSA